MKQFNLNYEIGVKLELAGFEVWKAHDDEMLPTEYHQPLAIYQAKADPRGYVFFQAWRFIQIFGPHTRIGVAQLYALEILIADNDLR